MVEEVTDADATTVDVCSLHVNGVVCAATADGDSGCELAVTNAAAATRCRFFSMLLLFFLPLLLTFVMFRLLLLFLLLLVIVLLVLGCGLAATDSGCEYVDVGDN